MIRMRPSGDGPWRACGMALLSLATAGCTTSAPAHRAAAWGACAFEELRIDASFPGARANRCRREADAAYGVYIEPEDTPINPSPWYAFRVTAPRTRSIEIRLSYAQSHHRYAPKLSYDGRNWFSLAADRLSISADGTEATLRVAAAPEPLWIAAQELFPNTDYDRWLERLSRDEPRPSVSLLGHSAEGRPIRMLDTGAGGQRDGTLVIVGRQHPPEVTGAFAMVAFVEALLADSPQARPWRNRFRLIVVPNLNPDGVEHGHWRHNRGGVDLNRDWGPFTQPETRLMRDLLQSLARDAQAPLALVLDFHSTWHDVMYTQRDDEPTQPAGFTARWIEAIRERLPDYPLLRDSQNTGVPSSRTYVYREYGIPSITYEVGDDTDRRKIERVARGVAAALMDVWSALEAEKTPG